MWNICKNSFVSMVVLFPVMALSVSALSITELTERVIENNPGIQALNENITAAEYAGHAARSRPDPEIEIGTENAGISEIEISTSQEFELGGKRQARIQAASIEKSIAVARRDYAVFLLKIELFRSVVPLLISSLRIEAIDSLSQLAEEALEVINRRIAAGAAPVLDSIRSSVELQELRQMQLNMHSEQLRYRNNISTLIGSTSLFRDSLQERLKEKFSLLALDSLSAAITSHPSVNLLRLEISAAEAELGIRKSEKAITLGATAGYVRNNENKENAFRLGLSFPLPVFRKSKASVSESEHTKIGLEHDLKSEVTRYKNRLIYHSDLFAVISQNLAILRENIIPGTALIYHELSQFYEKGNASINELLQARHEFFERKLEYLDMLEQKAMTAIDIMETSGVLFTITE